MGLCGPENNNGCLKTLYQQTHVEGFKELKYNMESLFYV
jgi:hypothetical protein